MIIVNLFFAVVCLGMAIFGLRAGMYGPIVFVNFTASAFNALLVVMAL